MTLILDGSQESLFAALNLLDDFGMSLASSLTVKTEALWIGSNSGRNETLSPERNFRWLKNS